MPRAYPTSGLEGDQVTAMEEFMPDVAHLPFSSLIPPGILDHLLFSGHFQFYRLKFVLAFLGGLSIFSS